MPLLRIAFVSKCTTGRQHPTTISFRAGGCERLLTKGKLLSRGRGWDRSVKRSQKRSVRRYDSGSTRGGWHAGRTKALFSARLDLSRSCWLCGNVARQKSFGDTKTISVCRVIKANDGGVGGGKSISRGTESQVFDGRAAGKRERTSSRRDKANESPPPRQTVGTLSWLEIALRFCLNRQDHRF
jgi:hypothetical protein